VKAASEISVVIPRFTADCVHRKREATPTLNIFKATCGFAVMFKGSGNGLISKSKDSSACFFITSFNCAVMASVVQRSSEFPSYREHEEAKLSQVSTSVQNPRSMGGKKRQATRQKVEHWTPFQGQMMTALEHWAETGVAPGEIVATKYKIDRNPDGVARLARWGHLQRHREYR
jgi:hypothetical protein